MKIGIVSTMAGATWGGSEELWYAMADKALQAGHELLVSSYDHRLPRDRWPPKLRGLAERGAKVHLRRMPIHHKIDPKLAWLGMRFGPLRAFKPDVVVVSQGASYDLGTYGDCEELRRYLIATRVPLVIVCQLNHEHANLSEPARQVVGRVFERAHTIAFVAERNRQQAERHLGVHVQGTVVRNPVNLSSMEPVPWPARAEAQARLACVARLELAYKGQDVLLEALATDEWRARAWSLSFFGAGPDEKHIRRLIQHYGLEKHVHMRGQVSDVRGIWAQADLLVLPSREEGTPLALVEAMVCGRGAVVTDVGGCTEWVREGESGFVASGPTVPELRSALQRAWNHRERWAEVGSAARATALKQVDPAPGQTLLELVEHAGKGHA